MIALFSSAVDCALWSDTFSPWFDGVINPARLHRAPALRKSRCPETAP